MIKISEKCPKCGSWTLNKKNGKLRCLLATCNYVEKDDEEYFLEFFNEMKQKIKDSQRKRGNSWKTGSVGTLRDRLIAEIKEWLSSSVFKPNSTSKELIDIANQAMLLWIRMEKGKIN